MAEGSVTQAREYNSCAGVSHVQFFTYASGTLAGDLRR